MQPLIVTLILVTAFVSEQAFENLLERHAESIKKETKKVRTFIEMAPDISFCYDEDVEDFAKCVMSLKKETQ